MRKMLVATLLLVSAITHGASVPTIQKFLPTTNAVRDFTILADSLVYGKGNDISKIYDGGYELYTRSGVIDAARQMYQRESDYVEVTIHTMKSAKTALDFLKYWQKEHKLNKLTISSGWSGFIVTKPNVTAYFVKGKYFATVSAFYSGDKAIKDVVAFRDTVAKAMPKQ